MKQLFIAGCIIVALSFVPDKKRYFYIVYEGEGGATGCFTIQSSDFPNLKYLESLGQRATKGKSCVVTNIIEIQSQTDFLHFSNTYQK